MVAVAGLDGDRDREGAGPRPPRHVGQLGAPEAAAGHQQGQRFEQVGLADAVLADEGDERRRDREVEVRVGAEGLEDETRDARRSGPLSLDGRGLG